MVPKHSRWRIHQPEIAELQQLKYISSFQTYTHNVIMLLSIENYIQYRKQKMLSHIRQFSIIQVIRINQRFSSYHLCFNWIAWDWKGWIASLSFKFPVWNIKAKNQGNIKYCNSYGHEPSEDKQMSVFVLIHFGFRNKFWGTHTAKLICSTPKLQSSYKL